MNYITIQKLKIQQERFSISFEVQKNSDFHYHQTSFN
jgi:hypothetical protein